MDDGKLLEFLGIGLSRLLRYSYGGFLLIVLASVVNPTYTREVLAAIPWELAALSALLIGASIYAVHRSVVIPIHHLGLCLILWARDKVSRTSPRESLSPTRWLGAIGVKNGEKMLAYTVLRRSDFFGERGKREFDVAHAESGLIVMTFEGLLLAAFYARFHPASSQVSWLTLCSLSLVFLVASYPSGYVQHQIECRRMRLREADVKATLGDLGMLSSGS